MSAQACAEIDTIVAAFYAAFDNRAARAPAVPELRGMFAGHARVTRVSGGGVESWSVDEFIAPRAAMLTDGTLLDFHEWETESNTTVTGNIASRRSQYRKTGTLNGSVVAGGGRKFIQLCRIDGRWMISSVLWEDG